MQHSSITTAMQHSWIRTISMQHSSIQKNNHFNAAFFHNNHFNAANFSHWAILILIMRNSMRTWHSYGSRSYFFCLYCFFLYTVKMLTILVSRFPIFVPYVVRYYWLLCDSISHSLIHSVTHSLTQCSSPPLEHKAPTNLLQRTRSWARQRSSCQVFPASFGQRMRLTSR